MKNRASHLRQKKGHRQGKGQTQSINEWRIRKHVLMLSREEKRKKQVTKINEFSVFMEHLKF